MPRRKKYYETDWGNLDEIIIYAYGKDRDIRSKGDVVKLFVEVNERIAKDKRYEFRKEHSCKDCFLYITRGCEADGFCRFDEPKETVQKRKVTGCPHNDDQPCCYANETGTCFGYCLKKIMKKDF